MEAPAPTLGRPGGRLNREQDLPEPEQTPIDVIEVPVPVPMPPVYEPEVPEQQEVITPETRPEVIPEFIPMRPT